MKTMSIEEYKGLCEKEPKPTKRHKRKVSFGEVPSEETEQRLLAEYLDLLGIRWFHVPNGGARNKAEGGKLKAQGVKPGVPDVFIVETPPNGPAGSPGTVIELKRQKEGKTSSEQQDWLDHLAKTGWVVSVCCGAAKAIDLVEKLGYSKNVKLGTARPGGLPPADASIRGISISASSGQTQ